jgi:hypothetical protein
MEIHLKFQANKSIAKCPKRTTGEEFNQTTDRVSVKSGVPKGRDDGGRYRQNLYAKLDRNNNTSELQGKKELDRRRVETQEAENKIPSTNSEANYISSL